jgi:hypothetical protein
VHNSLFLQAGTGIAELVALEISMQVIGLLTSVIGLWGVL